jgi:hypothetical protein
VKMLQRLTIGAALVLMASGMASATSLTGCADTAAFTVVDSGLCFQATTADQTIPWGPTGLTISQFNPLWGTLNYVEIIAWASGDAALNVNNASTTTTESFNSGFAHISESFSGTGFTTITITGGLDNQSGTVAPTTTLNGTSTPFNADDTGSPTFISNQAPFNNQLNPFIGIGNIGSLTGTGGPSSASGQGGVNLFYNATGDVGGVLAVLYDYTAPPSGTPEPATMALMGTALIGLGMLRRRLRTS